MDLVNIGAALLGTLLVAVTLFEVAQDLFHPSGSGTVSDQVAKRMFRLFRRFPRYLPVAGPLSTIAVIASWVALLTLGFGLLYYSSYPWAFTTNTGEPAPAEHRFLTSVYISAGCLVTLGYGDLVPQALPMRFLSVLEGLMGFALLTASVSWIVLLYPALGRTRLLARVVSGLVRAERSANIPVIDGEATSLLMSLSSDVTRVRIDLIHFPMIYYFSPGDTSASLAHAIKHLVRFSQEGAEAHHPDRVRFAAATLDCALSDLAHVIAERFISSQPEGRSEVFRAYTNDHLVEQQD